MNRLATHFAGILVLALLLGLALPALADEARGKVKTVHGDKNEFVLTDAAGKDMTIQLRKDGKVFINDKEAKFTDLQTGDEATVTYEIKNEQPLASAVRVARGK